MGAPPNGASTSAEAMDVTPADAVAAVTAEEVRYSYVVTAHRPTAVLACAVGSITAPDDINLIVSKCTRLEIHRLTADGLQGVVDVPIYGRLSSVRVFRPSNSKTDQLLIATERFLFCILSWDEATQQLVTLASGDATERTGRPCDRGHFVTVDPGCRAIALHQYDGILRIVPLDPSTGALAEAFAARIEELCVIDLTFLAGCDTPTLAVLHEDSRSRSRGVKTYCVSLSGLDLVEGPWEFKNLDAGACMVIPVQAAAGGGAIVVGETTLSYCNTGSLKSEALNTTFFRCWAPIDDDGSRLLLGDEDGTLYLLVVAHDTDGAVALRLQKLGTTSAARTLCHLDNGTCFIGSATGNSQLVRLSQQPVPPDQPNNYVLQLQSFLNLGPIVDFSVVDLDNSGQGQLVTCSGTGRDGSLRLVRNGIGISEQASIELQGIRGVWSMKAGSMEEHDKYLVITFVEATHVLAINDQDELDEAVIPGFNTDAMTLFCSSLDHDQMCQVTATEMRLLDATTGTVVATWAAPGDQIAKVESTGATTLLLSTGRGTVYLLETSPNGIELKHSVELAAEIASLDVAPFTQPDGTRLAAIGTWQSDVILLALPSLEVLSTTDLQTSIIPRSTLFMATETGNLLLVGMGDGHLIHWQVTAEGALQHKKQISLGMKPISLRSFTMGGQEYVFAASDRPTVVFHASGKLLYSHLNESNIAYLASFSSPSFPGALAIGKDNALMISTIDAIQKLHIRSVPLGEQPRRITHQPATSSFGVLTISSSGTSTSLKVVSQTTWELVADLRLDANELGNCICSVPSSTPGQEFFVVGTAYVEDGDEEPSKGRVLLISLTDDADGAKTLTVVAEKVVKGSVYQAKPLDDKIVVTVNERIVVLTVGAVAGEAAKRELKVECSHKGKTVSLFLAVQGNQIAVGDLMRSVLLYNYVPSEQRLELAAEEHESRWTTAVAAIDSAFFMAAENAYNLCVLRSNGASAQDDDALARLDCVGRYHLGDMVNRIAPGSLVTQLPDSEFAAAKMHIMGTVLGGVAVCVSLPEALFRRLSALQTALEQHVQGVGGLSHADWRSYCGTQSLQSTPQPALNFLDGDLIEQLLDLPRDACAQVMDLIPEAQREPLDDLVKLVEDLARLH